MFLPIGQRKSLPWSGISPENRFPILCILPLIAHQLASAGKKSTIRNRARISAPARVTSWLVCPIDGSQCPREFGRMSYQWPADTDFSLWELDVLDRNCPACGRMMHICDHRYRRFHTLDGPVQLICKLNHCPDPTCPGHAKTKSPELEITLALPQVAIGWDVFCWIGHRRCSRHMAIPLIQSELLDDYGDQALRRCDRPVHPTVPGHARGAAARPRVTPPTIRIRGGDHPLHRRPPAREGTRDPLRRAGVDPEAGVVR